MASFGSLAENARTLRDWLVARPDETFVLVSLSKGSLDVRTALTEPERGTGLPQCDRLGKPEWPLPGPLRELVTWVQRQRLRRLLVRLYCWWQGHRFTTLAEMERCPANLSAGRLRLPKHVRVLHVLGFPLHRHLSSPLARRDSPD